MEEHPLATPKERLPFAGRLLQSRSFAASDLFDNYFEPGEWRQGSPKVDAVGHGVPVALALRVLGRTPLRNTSYSGRWAPTLLWLSGSLRG